MMGGRPSHLRSTAALVAVAVLAVVVSAAVLVNSSGLQRTTAEGPLSDQNCTPARSCANPATSAHGGHAGDALPTSTPSHSATPATSATHAGTPTPTTSHTATPAPSSTHSATPAPTAAPTQAPVSTLPPAAGGYFGLRPVGSWSSLPSDAQCAAQVRYSTWEPRPENNQQNHTMPAPGAMAASLAARPRERGGNTYNPLWDSWLLKRVDGRFTGTTDEILQWAACKWGLPDNLIRADAVEESTWFAYLHFPGDASYGGGGGGSCYWDRACGDPFSSATAASSVYCNGIAKQGLLASEIHDYQKDPLTSVGGYPWTPGPGLCPKTFSILGEMSWDDPAWQAPYAAYPGNQNGTFPFNRDSTAAAADYWGAYIRGCYEGWEYWLKSTGTGNYAAGDLWGCIGSWFAGEWHSSAANTYIASVQQYENGHMWLTASFDDSSIQYSCDRKYGCPS